MKRTRPLMRYYRRDRDSMIYVTSMTIDDMAIPMRTVALDEGDSLTIKNVDGVITVLVREDE